MEYVVVNYPRKRQVLIDGNVAGYTNDTLMVEAGHHIFALGDPQEAYEPATVERLVENTTSESPLPIDDFHPL